MTDSEHTRLIGVGNSDVVHSGAATIADGGESGMSMEVPRSPLLLDAGRDTCLQLWRGPLGERECNYSTGSVPSAMSFAKR